MNKSVLGALVLCIALSLPWTARGQTDQEIAEQLGLTSWTLHRMAPIAADGPVEVKVVLGGEEYDLLLRPSSVRGEMFAVSLCMGDGQLVPVAAPPAATYRGEVAQAPGAMVAATVRDGQLDAMILLEGKLGAGATTWFVQPLSRVLPNAAADVHIVYRAADAPADQHRCGGGVRIFPPPEPPPPGGGANGLDNVLICELAIDADFAYYQQNGSNAANTTADVETVINNVSLVYEADANVSFQITQIVIRSTNWPYVSGVTAENLLDQFRNHWNANHTSVQRDVSHLFTGIVTSDSSIIGLAWVGVVCHSTMGYAYSRSRFSATMSRRTGLHAHELGHNFSATHCNESGGACSPCNIMCSSIGGCSGSTTSLGCSSTVISGFAGSRTCLSSGCTAPSITAHPSGRTATEGDRVTFSITASGAGPLSYQWRRNGANLTNGGAISGATSPTLAIEPVAAAHAGSYTCIVTNSCGSVTSNSASLVVNVCAGPAITAHPSPRTVAEGDPVSFSVTATGANLTYQWRRDGVNVVNGGAISGATSSTLSINPVAAGHAGAYTCVVTNPCGSLTSNSAILTVSTCQAPAVSSHPANRTVNQGDSAAFSVTATGTGPLMYRWRRNGVPLSDGSGISGAASAALTINPVAAAHAGQYDCAITSACGSVTSSAASLTVTVPPSISAHPVGVELCAGQRAVFSVTATGTGPLTYQWRRNGVALTSAPHLSGINTSTLAIEPAHESDAGTYTVAVSNPGGSIVSQPALLTVRPGAVITQQPQAQSIAGGARATFTVATQGVQPTSYRWRRNGQDLTDGDHIFGADSAALTINPCMPGDAGEYSVRIEHPCGTTISSGAALSVTAPAPSTLAWWRFEEGVDGTGSTGDMKRKQAVPSQTNTPALNAARGEGEPRYVNDIPGPELAGVGPNRLALRFEGEDSIRIPNSSLLNFAGITSGGGQFTIEMFVKVDPVPNKVLPSSLLEKRGTVGSVPAVGYSLWVQTGSAQTANLGRAFGGFTDRFGAPQQLMTPRLDDGRWRHLALRRYFDGQTVRTDLWLDYQRQGVVSGGAVGDLTNSAELWIGPGRSSSSSDDLVVWIDEVRISNRPLLPTEFLRVTQASSSCYANCDNSTAAPLLTAADFACFMNEFAAAQLLPPAQQVHHYANCDGSTTSPVLNINDFVCFVERFASGCP
jgi:hypothetical protein